MREGLWIRKLLHDFNLCHGPLDIRADNRGAIALVQESKMNARTKHIDVAYHLGRDYIEQGMVKATYIQDDAG